MKINDQNKLLATGQVKGGKSNVKKGDTLDVKDNVTLSGGAEETPFYGKPEFKETVKAEGVSSEEVKTGQSMTFNNIINLLSQASTQNSSVSSDLRRVEMDVDDAQREISFSKFDIREVENDNAQKNVSNTGYRLDRMVRTVERELQSGDNYLGYADRGLDTSQKNLSDAHKDLDTLGKALSTEGKYPQVVSLIDQAKREIEESFNKNKDVDQNIYDVDRKMGEAEREMQRAEMDTMRIKMDSVGKDVSWDGRNLSSKVDNTEWDLRDVDSEMRYAQSDLSGASNKINQAINTVRQAQQAFNSAAGIVKKGGLTPNKADVATAKGLIQKALKDLDTIKPHTTVAEAEAKDADEDIKAMPPHIKKIKLDFDSDVSGEGKSIRNLANNAVGDMTPGQEESGIAKKVYEGVEKDVKAAMDALKKANKEAQDKSVNEALWQLESAGGNLEMATRNARMAESSFKKGNSNVAEMGEFITIVEKDRVDTNIGYLGQDLEKLQGDLVGNMIDGMLSAKYAGEDVDPIKEKLNKALKNL